jgi:hypothetical protein
VSTVGRVQLPFAVLPDGLQRCFECFEVARGATTKRMRLLFWLCKIVNGAVEPHPCRIAVLGLGQVFVGGVVAGEVDSRRRSTSRLSLELVSFH